MTTLLGDPHLGKRFLNGVPMHRRGDREKMMERDFLASLENPDSWHVNLGDLFDRPNVAPSVVAFAADAYMAAARKHQETMFVVLMGNHDGSRDLETVTSFDLFQRIVDRTWNITVVRDAPEIIEHDGMNYLFVPWHPVITGEEMVSNLDMKVDRAFGHWDVVNIGNPHNLIPYATLRQWTDDIVTGHDHTRRVLDTGVQVWGSMQPYSHGEDPEGMMYRSVTLDQLEGLDTHDLCLRIQLREGEVLPDGIDALQIQVLRPGQVEADLGVDFGTLDFQREWTEAMKNHDVDPRLSDTLFDKYRNRDSP